MSDAAPSGAVRAAHANGFSRTPTGLSAEARSAEWSCIKRDGSTVPFDAAKIKAALRQCFGSIDLEAPEQAIRTHTDALVEAVVNILAHKKQFRPDVEEVQRLVIQQLWAANLFDAAEHYQNYRETRRRERAETPVDPALVAKFRAGMAPFTGPNAVLQQIQAIDKFARFQEALGHREVWSETVDRTMDFFQRHVAARFPDSVTAAQWAEARADLYELKSSPSMRTVQMAGPALDRCHVGVYNCAFLDMTGPRALAEDLYCLMQGTGVGFSVEYQHAIDKWPRVRKPRSLARTLTVEDTTEGWCDAVVEAVETFLDGGDVNLDTAGVRPAGAVLRTKGGRASGPQPLIDLINHCRVTIQARGGDRLTALDVHGMTCMLHRIGQMGGVRRASGISFSDLDDLAMRHAKAGPFWKTAPHLDQANNTAVYDDKPTAIEFMEEWLALAKSGTGERGIFNAGGLARQLPKRRKRKRMRGNPCGEIYLRDRQFCNLSIAVLRPDTPWEELRRRVRMATFWGTLQATMTTFGYLSDEWRKNCEEERLLGVDLLGHLDHELLGPGKPGRAVLLQQLLGECAAANQHWADTWGIPHSAALTCGKPAGDSSCFFDTVANFKPHHGAHWVRRLRFADHNPVARVLKAAGVPHQVDYNNTGLLVFEVPCIAPEGGVLLGQQTAIEQLENWLMFKENFTEHNPSISVYVKEDEWLATGHWVYDHWDAVGGLSFFPYFGGKYPLAPYETITAEEYRQRKDAFPAIDWSQITRYESEDMTTLSRQFACSSPDGCEI